MRQLTGTIDQLWTATPDPRGGSFLRHVSTGRVLACQVAAKSSLCFDVPAGPLQSANLDGSDPKQLWRREDLGGGWSGINAFLNWEGKVNVYGSNMLYAITVGIFHWDGGADNEEWNLVEETGEVTVDSVTYDLAKAVADLGIPPSQGTAITVDNSAGGTPVTSTYSLSRTVTTQTSITHSESDTTGQKYTQTFSVKGGIAKVVEVSASSSFEKSSSKTISLTDQKTNTESVDRHRTDPGQRAAGQDIFLQYRRVLRQSHRALYGEVDVSLLDAWRGAGNDHDDRPIHRRQQYQQQDRGRRHHRGTRSTEGPRAQTGAMSGFGDGRTLGRVPDASGNP